MTMPTITPNYKKLEYDWNIYEIENIKCRPHYLHPMICIDKKIWPN